MVMPEASPSSMRMAVQSERSGKGAGPRNIFALFITFRFVSSMPFSTSAELILRWGSIAEFSLTVPSKETAPYPASLLQGRVILLTTQTSRGSESISAALAATGTPPAGMAKTEAPLPR